MFLSRITSKKEALLNYSLPIWEYMLKHNCGKATAAYELGLTGLLHYCGCCDYDQQTREDNGNVEPTCFHCPLMSYWDKTNPGFLTFKCEDVGPYHEYIATREGTTEAKQKMVDLIKTAIADIEAAEKKAQNG